MKLPAILVFAVIIVGAVLYWNFSTHLSKVQLVPSASTTYPKVDPKGHVLIQVSREGFYFIDRDLISLERVTETLSKRVSPSELEIEIVVDGVRDAKIVDALMDAIRRAGCKKIKFRNQ